MRQDVERMNVGRRILVADDRRCLRNQNWCIVYNENMVPGLEFEWLFGLELSFWVGFELLSTRICIRGRRKKPEWWPGVIRAATEGNDYRLLIDWTWPFIWLLDLERSTMICLSYENVLSMADLIK